MPVKLLDLLLTLNGTKLHIRRRQKLLNVKDIKSQRDGREVVKYFTQVVLDVITNRNALVAQWNQLE